MPQLTSSFIMSERIKKLCKAMHNRSAVMITAPAGYGKTSLMVASLHTYGPDCRICWYRLEPEDSDLALFYAHFIEALFPAGEELWNDSRNTLADCGDIQSRHQYLNAVICQELWAFHNHHEKIKTFIVLDDFQLVKDSTEITSSIQYLINNLPDNCTFFISSRSETV
jgi:LuxR family maltose regulon positive regulatory protein